MNLKPGIRLRSACSEAEVVIVRAPEAPATLTCGNKLMVEMGESVAASIEPGFEGSILIGKRYVDIADTIEVLCTKAGGGILALDGAPLEVKSAKPLPSSD
jgi:hypothetical protein